MFTKIIPVAFCALLAAAPGQAADAVVLQIKADQVAAHVSPMLYGLMTEEINFSYDGGLYAELVRNRSFKEDAKEPVHWQLVQEQGGTGTMALDPSQPFNDAIPTSLKLTVTKAAGKPAGGDRQRGILGHTGETEHALPGLVLRQGRRIHRADLGLPS